MDHPSTYSARDMDKDDLYKAYSKLHGDYERNVRILEAMIIGLKAYPS